MLRSLLLLDVNDIGHFNLLHDRDVHYVPIFTCESGASERKFASKVLLLL